MMFATLDDLEGSVEMVVFNSAFEANGDRVDTDRVLIVKGRVDQKETGEVKLIVNEVEPFEPSAEEVAAAEAVADFRAAGEADGGGRGERARGLPRRPQGALPQRSRRPRAAARLRRAYARARGRVSRAADGSCLAELDHLPGAALVA